MKNALLFLMLPLAAAAAPTSLQFIPTAQQILPMPNGAVLTFGSSLAILDASGNQTASLSATALGTGSSGIAAAAIDGSGNIWIAGGTTSTDFPLIHPLYSKAGGTYSNAFVAKLSPSLNILFSTFVQGQPANGQTNVDAIALDSSGNAYIVGDTNDSNFPVTGPTFGSGTPSATGFQPQTNTFISEISADGSTLLYSRWLGGTGSECVGGSACEGVGPGTIPSVVAVDQSGSVVVAGATSARNFPVTVTPYPNGTDLFVARIAPGGGRLEWSTELTPASIGYPTVQSVAIDSSGNVYVGGTAGSPIAGTPDSLQPTVTRTSGLPNTAFVIKLSPDGTQMLYGTNLGGGTGSRLAGIALDSSGNLWATGCTTSPDFPGLSNVPASGVDFALELNANASALTQINDFLPRTICSYYIAQNRQPVFDSFGRILLLGDTGNLLRWNPDPTATTSAIFGLTNSATPLSMAGGAPGELATFYGVGIGPSQAIVATPDANGNYPTTLGGVTVGFSAGFVTIPARLLYVGPNQINFQVPFALSATTPVIVTTPTGPLAALSFRNLPNIGIFGVINPDGTINSQSNPAPVGSAVAIYATGLGAPEPSSEDGAIATSAENAFLNEVKILNLLGPSQTLPVLYAGTAPTLINGLDQINIQLPARQTPQIEIQTANANSNQISIYTH